MEMSYTPAKLAAEINSKLLWKLGLSIAEKEKVEYLERQNNGEKYGLISKVKGVSIDIWIESDFSGKGYGNYQIVFDDNSWRRGHRKTYRCLKHTHDFNWNHMISKMYEHIQSKSKAKAEESNRLEITKKINEFKEDFLNHLGLNTVGYHESLLLGTDSFNKSAKATLKLSYEFTKENATNNPLVDIIEFVQNNYPEMLSGILTDEKKKELMEEI